MKPHPGNGNGDGRENAGAKCDRLFHLLILMQGGPPRTADELAAALSVSRRSLFRYLQTFERCGIPYYHDDAARGYRIREDFYMRPLALTQDEAQAIADVCARESEQSRLLASAWSKIRAANPRAVRTVQEAAR